MAPNIEIKYFRLSWWENFRKQDPVETFETEDFKHIKRFFLYFIWKNFSVQFLHLK